MRCPGAKLPLKSIDIASKCPRMWRRSPSLQAPTTLVDPGQPSALTYAPSAAIGPVPVRHLWQASLNVLKTVVYCTVEAPPNAKAPSFRLDVAGLGICSI